MDMLMLYVPSVLNTPLVPVSLLCVPIIAVLCVVSQVQMSGIAASSTTNAGMQNPERIGVYSPSQKPSESVRKYKSIFLSVFGDRSKQPVAPFSGIRGPEPAIIRSFFVNVGPK